MSKVYGVKKVVGDGACSSCRSRGGDRTGNHLMFWENSETGEKWVHCSKCSFYELINPGNEADWAAKRKERVEKTPEQIAAALAEVAEYPIKELRSRGLKLAVAERFGVRVGVSETDGETPITHYYPKTVNGEIVGYKVRNLEHKAFWSVGKGSGCDMFGIDQAQLGDIYTKKLFIFEDELSAMSGFQALVDTSNSTIKPACVALPDGAGSAASAISRNSAFVNRFAEIVVCMDNDAAGDDAVTKIRAMLPHIKVARITKGYFEGKPIKDANDLLMAGRIVELANALRFNAAKESPSGAATVAECLDDALKKPEYGLSWPWPGMTELTFGLRYGDVIAVGGGVGTGKTLIAHEMCAHLINEHKEKCGVFMLEETTGNTLKNIAGKSANIPFHRPDAEFDEDLLRSEILKYDGSLYLYKNFGQNNWDDIKSCMRFWAIEHGVRFMFIDNITALVSHLSATEINTEVAKIAVELAGICNELEITAFIFSHLNPPKTGPAHEEGGSVQEVQFTGSRGLMRFSQLIIGFERNKQGEGDDKSLSQIRVLKDRYFGQTGIIPTKYNPVTGRLTQRPDAEYDPKSPFTTKRGDDEEGGTLERDANRPY